MSIDLTSYGTNIDNTNEAIDVTKSSETGVTGVESPISVEGYKREYTIVGDSLYASVNTDTIPAWLSSIVNNTIDTQITSSLQSLLTAQNSLLTALNEVEVAKNQYQELINIEATVDNVVASKLATLNAILNSNTANIVSLETTKVTPDEARAIAIDEVNSSINGGAIGAELARIDTTIANTNGSLAATTTMMESTYTDLATGIAANTSATNTLYSSTGINPDGSLGTTGMAGSLTAIDNYLKDENGNSVVGGTTNFGTDLRTNADKASRDAQSKFFYDSTIEIEDASGNIQYYATGFGLKANANVGVSTPTNPFTSEFWVKADTFKIVQPDNSARPLGDLALKSINDPLAMSASTAGITFNSHGYIKSNGADLTAKNGVFLGYPAVGPNNPPSSNPPRFLVGNRTNYLYYDGNSVSAKVNTFTMAGGTFSVNSSSSGTGARTVITQKGLQVYDGSNVLRVQLGTF